MTPEQLEVMPMWNIISTARTIAQYEGRFDIIEDCDRAEANLHMLEHLYKTVPAYNPAA